LWKDVGEGRFDRLSDCKCGDYKLDGWMFGNSWLSDCKCGDYKLDGWMFGNSWLSDREQKLK